MPFRPFLAPFGVTLDTTILILGNFRAKLLRKLGFHDLNAPLQPFTWFGGVGVAGWSKLALFWEVWGLAGALDSAAGWLDGIWVDLGGMGAPLGDPRLRELSQGKGKCLSPGPATSYNKYQLAGCKATRLQGYKGYKATY